VTQNPQKNGRFSIAVTRPSEQVIYMLQHNLNELALRIVLLVVAIYLFVTDIAMLNFT